MGKFITMGGGGNYTFYEKILHVDMTIVRAFICHLASNVAAGENPFLPLGPPTGKKLILTIWHLEKMSFSTPSLEEKLSFCGCHGGKK